MATTTNYSWTTPDDTALVKDGASAIRTLGSSADTTVKNLNPETTLGDIAYRSSTANVKTRLGLGTAGQVLTVNSGATAPEWATPTSGGMTLISTTTISNNATVSLTSIPGTYNDLYLVLRAIRPATDAVYLAIRFNSDSNANRHRTWPLWDTGGGRAPNATSAQFTGADVDNGATSNYLGIIKIPNYTNTTSWKWANAFNVYNNSTTATDITASNYGAFYNQTAAITSLDFFASSGNLTSGTILLYGVK